MYQGTVESECRVRLQVIFGCQVARTIGARAGTEGDLREGHGLPLRTRRIRMHCPTRHYRNDHYGQIVMFSVIMSIGILNEEIHNTLSLVYSLNM